MQRVCSTGYQRYRVGGMRFVGVSSLGHVVPGFTAVLKLFLVSFCERCQYSATARDNCPGFLLSLSHHATFFVLFYFPLKCSGAAIFESHLG